jgi:hypothetical protein
MVSQTPCEFVTSLARSPRDLVVLGQLSSQEDRLIVALGRHRQVCTRGGMVEMLSALYTGCL